MLLPGRKHGEWNFDGEDNEGEELEEREREGTNVAEREETAIEIETSFLFTDSLSDCVTN